MTSVLVAEDRDVDRASLIRVLTASGYAACPARTVEEALRALEATVFSLALINAALPGGDAMQVYRSACRRHVPAVMMTADPSKIVEFEDDGTPYLARPFEVRTFVEIVQQCANVREMLRDQPGGAAP